MRAYSPGGVLNALTSVLENKSLTPSTQRLQRGLPGYLIPFAPHAFALQRQFWAREPPSPLVFFPISTHFTATLGIPLSSPELKRISFRCSSWVEPMDLTTNLTPRLEPFTPNNSEQRSPHTYYRGCWHVVSRGFRQVPSSQRILPVAYSSLLNGLYNPKAFIVHAASLRQACAHCARFLTAASRRSLGRISVPMWPDTLSGRLPIVALVGRYLTN